jgi:hypothetical protein
VGLGFSLSSSEAIGYPAGAAVSLGTNPVWSIGGTIKRDGTGDVTLAAPDGQDMVVTDVYFSASSGTGYLKFTAEDGTTLAYFRNDRSTYWESSIDVHLQSGIRVPAGGTVSVTSTESDGATRRPYTLSGYYAQP